MVQNEKQNKPKGQGRMLVLMLREVGEKGPKKNKKNIKKENLEKTPTVSLSKTTKPQ